MADPLISVFTPAFNRADKIHRVFNSLLHQTLKDFEWIVVDDGSKDNTREIIEGYKKQSPPFPITYYYQENAGKHIAINRGLSMARGEWFHIADSDDELEPQTLEVFIRTWNEIPLQVREKFSGVAASCKDQYGNRISDKIPGGVYDGSFRDLFYRHKFRREVFMINKTSIMKQFPFPEYIRNYLYPEGIVWRKMTEKYPLRLISDEMRIYHLNDDPSQLSAPKSPLKKATPNCLESSSVLNDDLSWFIYDPIYFFKMALVYHSFLPFLEKQQREWVSLRPGAKVFSFIFIIPGRLYYRSLLKQVASESKNV